MCTIVGANLETIVRYAIDGIALGSIYALLALGLALIFGLMGLINFAHGELLMAGGYGLVVFLTIVAWPAAAAFVVVWVTVVAIAMERAAFRPVRKANAMTLLVTSFAISYLLQNLALLIFGSRAKAVGGTPEFLNETVVVLGVEVQVLDVVTIGVTVVSLTALSVFLARTSLGLSMLAAARDFDMARLVGVRADRVIAVAFGISGALAGTAAVILTARTGVVSADMGVQPMLIAFAGTIIGGMGSLAGATLGGFGLGIAATTLQAALPLSLRPFRDAFVFALVLVFLMVRPEGIIAGRATRERV